MKKMKWNKRLRSILIVAVLLLAVIGVLLLNVFLPRKIGEPITIPPDTISRHDVAMVDNTLTLCNSKGVMCYNNKGEYVSDVQVETSAPFMAVSDQYMVVADNNNSEILVYQDQKRSHAITESSNVAYVSVNKNGYVATLTREPGYETVVKVYNNKGNTIYKWYSNSLFVTEIALSENNKYMAVAGISPMDKANNSLQSQIVFFDLSKDEPLNTAVLSEQMACKMIFDKRNVYTLTDKGVYKHDYAGKQKAGISFGGKMLQTFSFDSKKNMAVALDRADSSGTTLNGCEIMVLDKNLKVKSQQTLGFKAKTMDCYDGYAAVAGVQKIAVLKTNGKIKTQGSLHGNCDTIKLFKNGKAFATVSGSEICVYPVKIGF